MVLAWLLAALLWQAPAPPQSLQGVVDSPFIELLVSGQSGSAPDGFGDMCTAIVQDGPLNDATVWCEPLYWWFVGTHWGRYVPAENPYPYCSVAGGGGPPC